MLSPAIAPRVLPGKEFIIRDSVNFRRHRNACKYYREDWGAPNVLYRCICLLDMPPETKEEQEQCLKSRRGCWRFDPIAEELVASRT